VQQLTAPPRDGLTAAQVTALIVDSAAIKVSAGCELLDSSLNVLADISADLLSGSVSHNGYATLHNTATLQLSTVLDWGAATVRPYMVVTAILAEGSEEIVTEGTSTESAYSDTYDDAYGSVSGGSTVTITTGGEVSARFNLGAYLPSVPSITHDMHPHAHDVQGFDILHLLNDPVGDAYVLAAGEAYLTKVEDILQARGFPVAAYTIDQSKAATAAPIARVWPMDENTTWLTITNDLLASIGYQGIFSDPDGRLVVQPYDPPRERVPEWFYYAAGAQSMLSQRRTETEDWFAVPNRWVAWRTNVADGDPPVDGDGRYEYINQSLGPTSVDARGGRQVTRTLPLDAADHASLVAAATQTIDADLRLPTTIEVETFPNPLHWHMDRIRVDDPHMGPPFDAVVTEWSLDLTGSQDMSQKWTKL
jgi:hypothetical protein